MVEAGASDGGGFFDLLGRCDDEFLGAWFVGRIVGGRFVDGVGDGFFVGGGALDGYAAASDCA